VPLSSGIKMKKNSRGSAAAAIAHLPSAVVESAQINANGKLRTVKASTVLTLPPSSVGKKKKVVRRDEDRHAKPHKERQYRRLKKPSKIKWQILLARQNAMRAAAEQVNDLHGLEETPATAAEHTDSATVDEERKDAVLGSVSSRAFYVQKERARRAAAKALTSHLQRLKRATELHRLAREAYDNRDKDLLEQRKREYAMAYGRVQRASLQQLRRYLIICDDSRVATGIPREAAVADAPAAVGGRENRETMPIANRTVTTTSAADGQSSSPNPGDTVVDDDGGQAEGDETTGELAQGLQRSPTQQPLQIPTTATVYPPMHQLSSKGQHAAPWMVDRRFVPTAEFLKSNNSKTVQGGISSGSQVTVEQLRCAMTPAERPFWWPPARVVRDYVTNVLTRELDRATEVLLSKLHDLQITLKREQPLKYAKQLRYVLGLREALRGLKVKRVKLVVIAPDVEAVGVLDAQVLEVVRMCRDNNVPHFFACSRSAFGRSVRQYKNRISLVAFYSAQGAYDELRDVVRLGRAAKEAYEGAVPGFGSGAGTAVASVN
jgi:ribosomal protein L7Ae-like RNA K-turn-binding protein